MSVPRALSANDPDGIAMLRTAIRSAGFVTNQVPELVGEPGLLPVARLPLALARLPDEGALSVLVRLFLLGIPVPRTEAEAALEPLSLARAGRMVLVHTEEGLVHAPIRIMQFDGFAIAADVPESTSMSTDHVMAVSGSSMFLSHLTIRTPVAAALDVGTGTGVQALLAARHADRVVGTDPNPRALSFARFNALLNDVHNVEFREGSLFEPVGDERFDLIVSNPPFVVSPDQDYLYRDSGGPGDEISRDVVRGAAEHLAPGGTASVLIGWTQTSGASLWERPTGWAADTGCDAWLLHHSSLQSLSYAVQWNAHLGPDPDLYLETVSRWVDHYRAADIGAIGYGAMVLRRREGPTWRRFDDLGGRYPEPAGDELRSLAALEDRLAGASGVESILDERPAPARHHLAQSLQQHDGIYEVEHAELVQDGGLRFQVPADPLTAELLARCDGRRTLREVVETLHRDTRLGGASDAGFDQAALAAAVTMLRKGFLTLEA